MEESLLSEPLLFIVLILGILILLRCWCASKVCGEKEDTTKFASEDLPIKDLVSLPSEYVTVSVLAGSVLSYSGVEMRVCREKYKLRVRSTVYTVVECFAKVGIPVVHSVLTVPPGIILEGISIERDRVGEYTLGGEQSVLTSPAFVSVAVDKFQDIDVCKFSLIDLYREQGFMGFVSATIGRFFLVVLPTRPHSCYSFVARYVVLFVELLFYDPHRRWVHTNLSIAIRNHIYHERLNTLSGLGSLQAHRLTLSSVQAKFCKTISMNTIYASVREFVINSVQEFNVGQVEHPGPVIDNLLQVPRVFDSQFSSVLVGIGWLESEKFLDIPAVVDNGRLELDPKSKGCTFVDGILRFDEVYNCPQGVYLYGPHVAAAAFKYTIKSTQNVSAALCRMTNSRKMEKSYRVNQDLVIMTIMGYDSQVGDRARVAAVSVGAFSHNDRGVPHTQYRGCIKNLTTHHRSMIQFVTLGFRNLMRKAIDQCDSVEAQRVLTQNRIDLSSAFSSEPHDKRLERELCFEEMMSLPFMWDKPLKSVSGKVKWEWAKHKKLCRQFVSLGCQATLYWPDLPRFLKESFDKTFTNESWTYTFVKESTQDNMDRWAQDVYDFHTGQFHGLTGLFFYHSDDSHFCARVKIGNKDCVVSVDLDIAKCDLSHGPGVFALLFLLCLDLGCDKDELKPLFDQLKSPLIVRHPFNKCDAFAKFKLTEITLFSGHVLTTIINNIGCLLIGLAIQSRLSMSNCFENEKEFLDCLVTSACVVGYEVTIDACTITVLGDTPRLSRNMFLKHFIVGNSLPSPFENVVNGFNLLKGCATAQAHKCISTIVRGYGISDDETTLIERRREILLGLQPAHNNFMLSTIFKCAGLEKAGYEYGSDDILHRYGVTKQELIEGLEMLFQPTEAVLVAHPALDAILARGYGLERL